MNAPPRFDSFYLMPNEPKIKILKDTKVPNAHIFFLNKEDHTVGCLLRDQLLKDPRVLFAGYRITHPLENSIMLRVQTTTGFSPHQAFTEAINGISRELDVLEERSRKALEERADAMEN